MNPPVVPGRFAGKRVLVTGGTRNIGLSIVTRFAEEGARLAVNGIVPGEADAVAGRLTGEGHEALAVEADVSDASAVTGMVDRIVDAFGGIDVLVNNAALPMAGRVPFFELTIEDWDRSFAVNARGVFLCSRAAARGMLAGSSIVNISSIGASKAHRNALAYDATKGAVEAFTRAAALELAPYGIRVNAVAPGAISNDRYQGLPGDVQRTEAIPIPLGRVGTGAEVAAAVAYLASAEAAYVTGQVLTIDGGLIAQARQASAEIDTASPGKGSR
ncbi:SDR family NAD(P)-dependent oxidoreductase [Dactylosporangium sp. CA-233914]|uniref:SDR family NAD(P)-dependent oxidoreductase n=1 Tax=Dactylosporangium sp. CA-233914 TaxID=3239934 RepID=UPI003D931FE9